MKTTVLGVTMCVITISAAERFQKPEPPRKPEPKVRELMRKKLMHSQKLMEAVVMRDYSKIGINAKALRELSELAEWRVFPAPEYLRHSAEFQRVTNALVKSAKDQNEDAAVLSYLELTLNCVQCHKYVRSQRMTFHHPSDRAFALGPFERQAARPETTPAREKDQNEDALVHLQRSPTVSPRSTS
jgi:hypothetical protein